VDFYKIEERPTRKNDHFEVYPEFIIKRSKDLMIRGGDFYVVFDKETGLWTSDKIIIQEAIDSDIEKTVNELRSQARANGEPYRYTPKYMGTFSSNQWTKFEQYVKSLPDNAKVLDQKVTFKNPESDPSKIQPYKKTDYVSKVLPYSLSEEPCEAWDHLLDVLYEPEEREKIEWAIGAILSGEASKIQKFLVFYGPQGSGKSTILNLVMKLLDGYYATFKAENLVSSGDQFGCKFLSTNPLVAIDEDTNLSRIETNATINKIASHEELEVNEKYKAQYVIKPMCMMMLGTNKPVRITDAKSGIIRRLIDIEPSGRKIKPIRKYEELIATISSQLGSVAHHCMQVYNDPKRGMHYYDDYVPERMMYRTDAFFNFMEENIEEFNDPEGISAGRLWDKWKDYCETSGIEFKRKRYEIVDEAKNYFKEFNKNPTGKHGDQRRSVFKGLILEKFTPNENRKKSNESTSELSEKLDDIFTQDSKEVLKSDKKGYSYKWIHLDKTESIFDKEFAECPAQYETGDRDHPLKYKWANCKTKLKDLETSNTHWVKGPGNLIFMDFDKHGPDGEKSLELNLKAAAEIALPKTYVELSNSGGGIHSYFYYHGNVKDLSNMFGPEIEIKSFPDDTNLSIRRRVSFCNDLPIAHISSGLPFKEEKKTMVNWDGIKDEQHLRNTINKAINKEIRPFDQEPKTVTLIKYIDGVLKDAQTKGIKYDISDLENLLYSFAASSHNHSSECINMFYSWDLIWPKERKDPSNVEKYISDYKEDAPIIILDCEVTNNLILIVYKELEPDGKAAILKNSNDRQKKCVRLYNPKPSEVEKLFDMRIVGHNVVNYDNKILYALYLGYSPHQICELSSRIINNDQSVKMYESKNISYTDTLDVSSEKKGLKKIEIEMHIPHKEMEIEWGADIPESDWERLAQYCENDVLATEAYFLSKKWQVDFKARKILAALTGMTVNDSTNNLVAQLIFGDVREPWHEFNYPDLKKEFPKYRFENHKSYYGDELIGEGGRVYAEPGGYYDVITFDVASMHPTSIIVENGFGPYTQGYKDLYEARIAIKHKDYEKARKLFNGRLAPYLENDEDADDLAYALKIALNSTYGMTAASFQNRFKDPRNVDNWVAKRGALFMEKLRLEVQKRGGHVIHIKTDSIKLVKPSKELQDFVIQFGKDHGYTFEIESRYERICLVNHAVYIALRAKDDEDWLKECKKAKKAAEEHETPYFEPTRWTATGAQFAHPFVFKHLFSHEPMEFWDFCETKTVKTSLYLDLNEQLKNVEQEEKEKKKIETRIRKLNKDLLKEDISDLDKEKIKAELQDLPKDISVLDEIIAEGHHYLFVGKAGEFMPVKPGCGGGLLVRKESDGGFGFATGAKGYRWLESETLQKFDNWRDYIDIRYFRGLVDEAVETVSKYVDFEMFVKGDEGVILPEEHILDDNIDPWMLPCKTEKYAYCSDCPDFTNDEHGYSCKQGYKITNTILGESKEILV